jgi:hypothetical protein
MSMSGTILKWLTSPSRLAPIVASSLVLLVVCIGTRAQPPSDADTSTVRGRIERFTTAPMGEVDGAVLDDGTCLHWPPHMQDRFTAILKEADRVRATGRTETGPAGDTHVEIQSVTDLRSNAQAENPDFAKVPPPPPPGPGLRPGRAAFPPPPPAARASRDNAVTSTVRGRIVRFTTAPMGEVDGAVLDDGTWLHWPPHMQDRVTGILKAGDRIRASGRTETGPAGDTHFEIQSVTNLGSNAVAENPNFSAPPSGPRPAARSADREQRLRDLEDQVQQILREIPRLWRQP